MKYPNSPNLQKWLEGSRWHTAEASVEYFDIDDEPRWAAERALLEKNQVIDDLDDRATFRYLTTDFTVPSISNDKQKQAFQYLKEIRREQKWQRWFFIAILLAILLLALSSKAHAQQGNVNIARVVANCSTPPSPFPSAGNPAFLTVDTSGNLCAGVSVSATVATAGLATSVLIGSSSTVVAPVGFLNNAGTGYAPGNLDGSGNLKIAGSFSPAAAADTVGSTSALGALNNTVTVALAGQRSAVFRLQAGTLVGTLVAEGSTDGGSTYPYTAYFTDVNWPTANADTASLVLTNPNAVQSWMVRVASAFDHVRVRVSAYTSGTVNGNILATANQSSLLELTTSDGSGSPQRYIVNGIKHTDTSYGPFTSDNTGNLNVRLGAAIPTGANVIGHVIADTGSTTVVTGNVAVTAASGSVASGAIASGAVASGAFASGSISDGADVTLGAKADAKSTATDTTAITAMQVLKEISFMEQTPASRAVTNAGTFATQSAITAASGSIASGAIASGAIASGAIASGAVASGAVASGAYASGSISDGADVTLGAKGDAKSTATDTTAITIMQVLKEISAMEQAPASRAVTNAGTFADQATLQTQTDTVMVGGVNIKEINAVTPLMGAGNGGTGSLRVNIASDQVSIPTASTLQTQTDTVMVGGVNIKEINAVTPLMGNGVTGTGSQRVTIASDNTAFGVKWTDGTNTANVDPCQTATRTTSTTTFASTTVQKLITKASAKKNYLCSLYIQVAGTAEVWNLEEGTKTTNECDTSTAVISGSSTAANGNASAANGGAVMGMGGYAFIVGQATNVDMCMFTSGSNRVTVTYTWAQL